MNRKYKGLCFRCGQNSHLMLQCSGWLLMLLIVDKQQMEEGGNVILVVEAREQFLIKLECSANSFSLPFSVDLLPRRIKVQASSIYFLNPYRLGVAGSKENFDYQWMVATNDNKWMVIKERKLCGCFQKFDRVFCERVGLAPKKYEEFIFYCDVPSIGLRAVLIQEGRLFAYSSKVLPTCNCAKSVFKKKLMVSAVAIQQRGNYVLGYNFEVNYKSSLMDKAADDLSWSLVVVISQALCSQPKWMDFSKLQLDIAVDSYFCKIIIALQQGFDSILVEVFSLLTGVTLFQVVYGRKLHNLIHFIAGTSQLESVGNYHAAAALLTGSKETIFVDIEPDQVFAVQQRKGQGVFILFWLVKFLNSALRTRLCFKRSAMSGLSSGLILLVQNSFIMGLGHGLWA